MDAKGFPVRRPTVAPLLLLLLLCWPASADGQAPRRHFPRQSDGEAPCSAQGRFQVNGDTIIRTQDSRLLGAKYLNETELPSQRQCLAWCCQTAGCNVAVFEQKDKGSCYLFDCGPSTDFKCKFTAHHHYSSAILDIGPPGVGGAPDAKGYPPVGDEHIAALKNLKNQVQQPAATEGQKPGETETLSRPGPTASASTTVGPAPAVTSRPSAAAAVIPSGKPSGGECTHFQFQCRRSGECIAVYNACDGIPQCSDGSDESEDLGCPTDGRRYPGLQASPPVPEKPSFIENAPLTSGQEDKPRPVENPETLHRPAPVGSPTPSRAASAHVAKSSHRGQKPETPKSSPNPQPKDHPKFDGPYDGQQGALQNPDARHYAAPAGHQSEFSGNGDGHPKESGAPPTRYDHAYPKAGSPLKSALEAHGSPQTYHRQHGPGGDPLVEADALDQTSVARKPFDKGRNPDTDHRIPTSDDNSRHYYDAPPQYDAGRQEDPDSSLSGQYGSDRTNGGYAREYYEGGYPSPNTDYGQKGSHYQQHDSQYVAHDPPSYGHHASDVHEAQSKAQNWPPHQPVYNGRNADGLDQGSGPSHQGPYAEHRYPVEPLRPVSALDIPPDRGSHGQEGRQEYGADQLNQPVLEHEENADKYWPLPASHNLGPQPGIKKVSQDSDGPQAPQHQKSAPAHDPSHIPGGRPNTEEPQAAEEAKGHSPSPPAASQSPSRPEEPKAATKTAAKPQHRVSHVELSLAEVEVTKAERSSESSGAILALTLGLSITGLMLVLVGCRLRMVRRRLRRGRSPYAHDADYLVNGMYL